VRRQDVIIVQNYSKTVGNIGQTSYDTPDGPPVKVECNVYPLDADEETRYGLQEIETRKVVCDAWPGRAHSRMTFEGENWDQHAPEKNYSKSFSARSVQVVIKKRG